MIATVVIVDDRAEESLTLFEDHDASTQAECVVLSRARVRRSLRPYSSARTLPTFCPCSAITIGLIPSDYNTTTQVGALAESYGYRGDTGKKVSGDSPGAEYGPTFAAGDVVGVAYDVAQQEAFFTRNGDALGEPRVTD